MSRRPHRRSPGEQRAEPEAGEEAGRVPGPSSNPATNLLIMDVAVRGVSLLAARAIEKAALRLRYPPGTASDIVKGHSTIALLAATGAARLATRSVPGFLVVSGGLLAKALIDRSLHPRVARKRGDKRLTARATKAAKKR